MRRAGKLFEIAAAALLTAVLFAVCYFSVRALSYPMPHRAVAEESGLDTALVYAVMKAESGFNERAESEAGALGLMQLMPSTAEFLCRQNKIEFSRERLFDGAYNLRLGCLYLKYLLRRFRGEKTALAAYNAGEGTVARWLTEAKYSPDGATLEEIPYPETERYLKKVQKFRKIYLFLYH